MSKVTRRYAVLTSRNPKDHRNVVLTIENPTKISNEYNPIHLAGEYGYRLFFAPKDLLNVAKVKLAKHYGSPEYVGKYPDRIVSSWGFLNDLKSGEIMEDATTDSYWANERQPIERLLGM